MVHFFSLSFSIINETKFKAEINFNKNFHLSVINKMTRAKTHHVGCSDPYCTGPGQVGSSLGAR